MSSATGPPPPAGAIASTPVHCPSTLPRLTATQATASPAADASSPACTRGAHRFWPVVLASAADLPTCMVIHSCPTKATRGSAAGRVLLTLALNPLAGVQLAGTELTLARVGRRGRDHGFTGPAGLREAACAASARSEERRVGKECRSRW